MSAIDFDELVRMQQGVARSGSSTRATARPAPTPAPTPAPAAAAVSTKPPMMLLETWDGKLDPTGWYFSEKYDGVRGWWDGKEFVSRGGNAYVAPALFKAKMPRTVIEGELWMGRGTFQTCSGVARGGSPDDWANMKFMAFDVPDPQAPLELRLTKLYSEAQLASCPWLVAVEQTVVKSAAHLRQLVADVEAKGGEGGVIRRPGSTYKLDSRSTDWLRVVSVLRDEAVVIGYTKGKGGRGGGIGALICAMPNGQQFRVGTGLKAADLQNPPPVGTVITYGYKKLTDGGVPREPRYVGVRDDG
jgi:DNA ligase-1